MAGTSGEALRAVGVASPGCGGRAVSAPPGEAGEPAGGSPVSGKICSVPVVPMTAAAFAPYGEVFGRGPAGAERALAGSGFAHRGAVTLGTIWNPAGERGFTRLERHFAVTQAFVQLSGAPSVVCVAPPGDPDDDRALPDPRAVTGFLIDPGQGYLFHRGTWHSLDRLVLSPPGATFLIVNVEPNPTRIVDFADGSVQEHDDLGVSRPRSRHDPRIPLLRFELAL